MIAFRLYADLMFNRDVGKDVKHISPGGYRMVFNGKRYEFDFEDSEISVDDKNPRLVHVVQKNPDYTTFRAGDPGEGIAPLDDITTEDLKHLSQIEDFYVDTDCCDDLHLVSVSELAFESFGRSDEDIDEVIDCTGKAKTLVFNELGELVA